VIILPEMILAAEGGPTLSSIFSSIIGDFSAQFASAVPVVAGVVGSVIVVVVGVPLVLRFFRQNI
jgi:putative Mn2+ efflux pump MntP